MRTLELSAAVALKGSTLDRREVDTELHVNFPNNATRSIVIVSVSDAHPLVAYAHAWLLRGSVHAIAFAEPLQYITYNPSHQPQRSGVTCSSQRGCDRRPSSVLSPNTCACPHAASALRDSASEMSRSRRIALKTTMDKHVK